MILALRTQKVLMWLGLAMAIIWGLSLGVGMRMIPPVSAEWTVAEIANFYAEHALSIKFGAVIASWASAGILALVVVIAVQIRRHEPDRFPLLSMLCAIGGGLMTVFMALPCLLFGAAAFSSSNAGADAVAVVHELAVLSFITTDQFFIFIWAAVAVVCLRGHTVAHSPFPRWFGYLTIWTAVILEGGAIAFLFRSGPFAWNGLVPFWAPTFAFIIWFGALIPLLTKAINAQIREEEELLSSPDERAGVAS